MGRLKLFQVYIIDDEELILKGLEKGIPWYENGFEVVGRNQNPLIAIEEISKLYPHVVFTDLKMPIMNGLELIERVREIHPDAEFVIVSAYSDFDLVRSSFKLNISDYLLKPVSREDCHKVLQHLWEKLQKKYKTSNSDYRYDRSNDNLNLILDYIQQNVNRKHTLASVSSYFYISPNTICQYFSKYLNTTFVNYITEIRMQKARQLMSTNKTIKEIASLCGYEDYFYFCKVFQNHFHCTPTQLRKIEASDEH